MKKIMLSLVFYFVSAFGISLTIVANVGVSSFNALNVALSTACFIQVGTITTITNLAFLILSILLTRGKRVKEYVLMGIALICFGYVINFFVYHVLNQLDISSYIGHLLLFISGTCIAGFGTGQVLRKGVLKFPIEACCMALAEKTGHTFARYRYGLDVVFVCCSLLLSLGTNNSTFVREGTIISLFLLSGVIHWSKEFSFQSSVQSKVVASGKQR